MSTLNSKQIYVTQPMPQSLPALPVQFVKPLSYEFRVAEHLDENGVVTRVGLQMQIYEHDEWGAGTLKAFWHDVNRVRIKSDGSIV
jgi:hypothetical protein